MTHTDILIIGAGVAGISAAKAAAKSGKSVCLADREPGFGGVLRQCSHKGFGSGLTGPEYIEKLLEDFPETVELYFSTTVLKLRDNKTALLASKAKGLFEISFSKLILASGCMEITPGMLPIGGTRPEGVYTAGQAQLMSFCGEAFKSPVVILGSGDLGLIMARQLKEQGHEISLIVEKNPVPTAMARNRGILSEIPIEFNSSISSVNGEKKLESVTIYNIETGASRSVPCSTLLIAAGLKPDRTLLRGLEITEDLICCGNCDKIYPMVEGLSADAAQAATVLSERN